MEMEFWFHQTMGILTQSIEDLSYAGMNNVLTEDEMRSIDFKVREFARMKPTDIWSNLEGFIPKCCNNGDCCHESAPRGSKTGTQGEKNSEYRGVVPELLCKELLSCCFHFKGVELDWQKIYEAMVVHSGNKMQGL